MLCVSLVCIQLAVCSGDDKIRYDDGHPKKRSKEATYVPYLPERHHLVFPYRYANHGTTRAVAMTAKGRFFWQAVTEHATEELSDSWRSKR
ncbi:uncharacterized protein BDZ83DRAFT_632681 [Colletotrichum acutatum]|uniref:Secreted protein n=1 Tax=Glomerella acutata TaxID=27357 RepID=A0AAD8UGI5_GLOAC|nr:uncharacterized protein BDZ83DRAFT_632681 [Colletotrichum acutatum]KAK1718759.1 hypothetical protein BDZ83DRAFT_632681 [Colletotrichum acutatum]